MMAYQSWSVVFGEQPSAAKWNILGTNDASFADGTGIANMEIGSGHTSLKIDYKFSCYRNAALTYASPAIVPMDTELFDTGNNLDTTTNKGRFTAPIAGFYWFSARFGVNSNGSGYIAYLSKNGTEVLEGTATIQSGGSWENGFAVSGLLQLSATDYIEPGFYGSGQACVTGSAHTYFHGCLFSQL